MKKLKQNRTLGFIIIALIYIFVSAIGIILFKTLQFDWWLNLLIADVVATLITYIFSVIFNNASVYDPYWSVQPIVILTAFAVGNRLSPERLLLLIAVLLWGIRLTANWCYTFHSFEYEDWRYRMLKEKTDVFYPFINLLGIHLVPTLVVYLCVLPAVHAFVNEIEPNFLFYILILISYFAFVLQGIADVQMHAFRKNKTSNFIRNGLWKYSRHPNYLGEILMWWGVGLSVVSLFPESYYLLAGAICNTLLFICVSIPMADKRQSSKEGFCEYKSQTRALLPIAKKSK